MDTDDVWNSFFGGNFESIVRRMEKMFSDQEGLRSENIKTYGYTMYQDSEGNRHMREYGNSADDRSAYDMAAEPLTDVTLENGTVRAVMEIPGVSKEDIVLDKTKRALYVSVSTDKRKFARTLALPCDVDPDSAKAEYNNGILEVTFIPAAPPGSYEHPSIQ
ncbi:MAG: Hsp20/alpha crystallin family protein [Methanomassiliicoccaceae archaeon]|nr:Hsp20/alpha crystallin family protein [Methanomassiliicoccaceae archaeon]